MSEIGPNGHSILEAVVRRGRSHFGNLTILIPAHRDPNKSICKKHLSHPLGNYPTEHHHKEAG